MEGPNLFKTLLFFLESLVFDFEVSSGHDLVEWLLAERGSFEIFAESLSVDWARFGLTSAWSRWNWEWTDFSALLISSSQAFKLMSATSQRSVMACWNLSTTLVVWVCRFSSFWANHTAWLSVVQCLIVFLCCNLLKSIDKGKQWR